MACRQRFAQPGKAARLPPDPRLFHSVQQAPGHRVAHRRVGGNVEGQLASDVKHDAGRVRVESSPVEDWIGGSHCVKRGEGVGQLGGGVELGGRGFL